MHTWFPEDSVNGSVNCLDVDLLKQQVYDCTDILTRLELTRQEKHVLLAMWRGFAPFLGMFGATCAERCVTLDLDMSRHTDRFAEVLSQGVTVPPWMGCEDLHSSHRAQLLLRGERLEIRRRMKQHYQQSTSQVNKTLQSWGFPNVHILRLDQIEFIHEGLDKDGAEAQQRNHYAQFGWNERPAPDQYWPVEV